MILQLEFYSYFDSAFYKLQPYSRNVIKTHSRGKVDHRCSVILPTFPREIHGYSLHQPRLGMAKASNMMLLREEFYSCPETYKPKHAESVLNTNFAGNLCTAWKFWKEKLKTNKTYDRDPKCWSRASLVSMLAMLLIAKSWSSGKYLNTARCRTKQSKAIIICTYSEIGTHENDHSSVHNESIEPHSYTMINEIQRCNSVKTSASTVPDWCCRSSFQIRLPSRVPRLKGHCNHIFA